MYYTSVAAKKSTKLEIRGVGSRAENIWPVFLAKLARGTAAVTVGSFVASYKRVHSAFDPAFLQDAHLISCVRIWRGRRVRAAAI